MPIKPCTLRAGPWSRPVPSGAGTAAGKDGRKQRRVRLWFEALEERTLLTYSARVVFGDVAFQGDAAGDLLVFDVLDPFGANLLRHNRFSAGDPGFASDLDFDSSQPGEQSLPNDPFFGPDITVNAGAGDDTVTLGDAGTPSVFLQPDFTVSGDAGTDALNLDDSSDTEGRLIGVTSSFLVNLTNSPLQPFLNYATIEQLRVSGGAGDDTIRVDSTADGTGTTLMGGAGDDTAIVQATGLAGLTLDGQAGSDRAIIQLGALAGRVTVVDYGASFGGTSANDSLTLTDRELTLGTQTVDVTRIAPQPTLAAGAGDDLIDASAYGSPVILDGQAGNDTILGGSGDDELMGGSENDVFQGGAGSNTLEGGGGTDLVRETGDLDFMLTDTLLLGSPSSALAAATASHGGVQAAAAIAAAGASRSIRDTLQSVERVAVTGGAGGNVIRCTESSGKELSADGGDGNDLIDCRGWHRVFASGGAGNDTIYGAAAADAINVLSGGEGDDLLSGGAGNDTLDGGPGSDIVLGGGGNDSTVSGAGCDIVNGQVDPSNPDCLADRLVSRDDLVAAAGADHIEQLYTFAARAQGITTFQFHASRESAALELELSDAAGVVVATKSGTGALRIDQLLAKGTPLQLRVRGQAAAGDRFGIRVANAVRLRQRDNRLLVATGGGNDQIEVGRDVSGSGSGAIEDLAIGANGAAAALATRYDAATLASFFGASSYAGLLIKAGAGDDRVVVDASVTAAVEIRGNRGDDTLTGGSGNDTLDGGPDNDACSGGGGVNQIVNCEAAAAAHEERPFLAEPAAFAAAAARPRPASDPEAGERNTAGSIERRVSDAPAAEEAIHGEATRRPPRALVSVAWQNAVDSLLEAWADSPRGALETTS